MSKNPNIDWRESDLFKTAADLGSDLSGIVDTKHSLTARVSYENAIAKTAEVASFEPDVDPVDSFIAKLAESEEGLMQIKEAYDLGVAKANEAKAAR